MEVTQLFDTGTVKKTSQRETRKRKMKLCYALTAPAWKAAVYEFATVRYLPGRTEETFIFEELTHAYEEYAKANGRPLTIEKRAFAGLQARLTREGLIEATDDIGFSYEGNKRTKYRSLV